MDAAELSYMIERAIYALAMVLGCGAFVYTARRFHSSYRRHVITAARLMCFKTSLTIADLIVLFVYAPTQIIWISTYYWYGGNILCRTTKFINTFSLHLTANMQVLIATDRLYITAHLRRVHQRSRISPHRMVFVAWLLAIACALPQLLVFQATTDTPDGNPQCVSIWTIMRYHRHIAFRRTHYESELSKNTSHTNDDGVVITSWDHESFEPFSNEYHFLSVLEHAYNILHLLSIYIVPYSIELFCYTVILLLMRNFHKKGSRESYLQTRSGHSMTITLPSHCTESGSNVDIRDLFDKDSAKGILQQNSKSRTQSLLPFTLRETEAIKTARRHFGSLSTANGRARSGTHPSRSSFMLKSKKTEDFEMCKQRLIEGLQKDERKPPWQITMSVARRRTRTKAFFNAHSQYDFLDAILCHWNHKYVDSFRPFRI